MTHKINLDSDTIILDADAGIIAEQCVRGDYQRALLRGDARWSGADLRGRARSYAGHYTASRHGLRARLRRALSVHEVRGSYDRRVVVLASDPVRVRIEGPRSARVLIVEAA